MSIFKCKMCGGTIEFESGSTVGECQHCGTKQTLPKLDDDRKTNLYDRANHFRRNNDYDKAAGIYEQILNDDPSDAEAYWSLVLCQYGIEYVEDPATHKRVPTVNRTQFTSIFDDDNYKSALQYADTLQQTIYEQEANAINEIQKGILSISQKEDPFDIFICYKETDNNGRRTQDSVLANDLYHQLTQEGFKVFFSRITLEDKLGTAYEPYIFAALNSAKVMVVLGTKPEYFNAVWVKNEWSRYLGLVKNSNGKKILIPAYKDMDPYDLPEEFAHLQAQDMSKLGFMQDLIRGIKKIVREDNTKQNSNVEERAVNSSKSNIAALLKRVSIFFKDGKYEDADAYCEKVLDLDPENAEAYLGKLMAEAKISDRNHLSSIDWDYFSSDNYYHILDYGDDSLVSFCRDCEYKAKQRSEQERIERENKAIEEKLEKEKKAEAERLEREKRKEKIIRNENIIKQLTLETQELEQDLAICIKKEQSDNNKIFFRFSLIFIILGIAIFVGDFVIDSLLHLSKRGDFFEIVVDIVPIVTVIIFTIIVKLKADKNTKRNNEIEEKYKSDKVLLEKKNKIERLKREIETLKMNTFNAKC